MARDRTNQSSHIAQALNFAPASPSNKAPNVSSIQKRRNLSTSLNLSSFINEVKKQRQPEFNQSMAASQCPTTAGLGPQSAGLSSAGLHKLKSNLQGSKVVNATLDSFHQRPTVANSVCQSATLNKQPGNHLMNFINQTNQVTTPTSIKTKEAPAQPTANVTFQSFRDNTQRGPKAIQEPVAKKQAQVLISPPKSKAKFALKDQKKKQDRASFLTLHTPHLHQKYSQWKNRYDQNLTMAGSQNLEVKPAHPFTSAKEAKKYLRNYEKPQEPTIVFNNNLQPAFDTKQVSKTEKNSVEPHERRNPSQPNQPWRQPAGLASSSSHRSLRRGNSGIQIQVHAQYIDGRKNHQYVSPTNNSNGVASSLNLLTHRSKTPTSPNQLSYRQMINDPSSKKIPPNNVIRLGDLGRNQQSISAKSRKRNFDFTSELTQNDKAQKFDSGNQAVPNFYDSLHQKNHFKFIRSKSSAGADNKPDEPKVHGMASNKSPTLSRKKFVSTSSSTKELISKNYSKNAKAIIQQVPQPPVARPVSVCEIQELPASNRPQTSRKCAGSPERSGAQPFSDRILEEIVTQANLKQKLAEKMLEADDKPSSSTMGVGTSIVTQFRGDTFEHAYNKRKQSRLQNQQETQSKFLSQQQQRPSTLHEGLELDHIRLKNLGRDLEQEKIQNQHNIGKCNEYRFAQHLVCQEGVCNTLKNQMVLKQATDSSTQENQIQKEQSHIKVEIEKEQLLKQQEIERKRIVQRELLSFYKQNSKTCFKFEKRKRNDTLGGQQTAPARNPFTDITNTEQPEEYKREMADILKEQLKSRRKQRTNDCPTLFERPRMNSVNQNQQLQRHQDQHVMSSLNLGLAEPE